MSFNILKYQLLSPVGITGWTTAGYIIFYTGYSKKTKSLQVSMNEEEKIQQCC